MSDSAQQTGEVSTTEEPTYDSLITPRVAKLRQIMAEQDQVNKPSMEDGTQQLETESTREDAEMKWGQWANWASWTKVL